ncbi:MAG: universal stress protein [Mycobacteriales bacterium]
MSRVLVATDGSAVADHAARTAFALLGADHEVTLLTVVGLPMTPVAMVGGPGVATAGDVVAIPVDEQGREPLAEEGRAALARARAAVGWDATEVLEWGDAASEICRVAEEGGYDLVVIGSHGSGALRRALLGSVSHHVLHHAPCPVLVVRAEPQPDR